MLDHFKRCNTCGRIWRDREDFLSDPGLQLVGYQVNFKDLEAGLILFQHDVEGCGTSLALWVEQFIGLYNGPVFAERMTGTEVCPTYCLYEHKLGACKAACECAWVREVLQIVKEWPKKTAVTQ